MDPKLDSEARFIGSYCPASKSAGDALCLDYFTYSELGLGFSSPLAVGVRHHLTPTAGLLLEECNLLPPSI